MNAQTLTHANISTAIAAISSEIASFAIPPSSGPFTIAAIYFFVLEAITALISNNSEPDNTELQEAVLYLSESE